MPNHSEDASVSEHSKHCPAHAGGKHIPELCDDTEGAMTEPVDANGIWQKHTMLREAAIARARATYQRSIADAEDEFAANLAKEAVNAIMVNAGRGDEVLP